MSAKRPAKNYPDSNMTLPEITAAFQAAQARGVFPTALGAAELRRLGADFLARVVFTARGTSAVFVGQLKRVLDQLAAGELGEGQVRAAIAEVLDLLGYDSELGGFPGEEIEPKLKGTLQDLRSFRRMDLIVRTQRDLMTGAGLKLRGTAPERLREFPAWELIRVKDVDEHREWPARWALAGGQAPAGQFAPGAFRALGERTGMIALKGSPVWGELGAVENFDDALSVDHPPFCYNSGMGWREVSREEVEELGITGPDGETAEEFLASAPQTLTGAQALPAPRISMRGVDPAIVERFKAATMAETGGRPMVFDYSDVLARELEAADAAYQGGGAG
jgi:hypothetical protein